MIYQLKDNKETSIMMILINQTDDKGLIFCESPTLAEDLLPPFYVFNLLSAPIFYLIGSVPKVLL